MSKFETLYLRYRKYLLPFEWAFSIVYLLLFVYVVFFARRRKLITHRERNLRPVKEMVHRYRDLSTGDAAAISNFYQNLYGNIAMFIPLPIILLTLFKIRNPWLVMFICVAISCGIEITQYIFAIGIADSDDIILNSMGAFLGILLYSVYLKLLKGKQPPNSIEKIGSNSLS